MIPEGRQLVERYGGGGFQVSGTRHAGSVLVLPEATAPWAPKTMAEIDGDELVAAVNALLPEDAAPIEVLLLGCGAELVPPKAALRQALKAAGMVVEPMATGAACRTYNVLAAEDRRVAAALIAVQ